MPAGADAGDDCIKPFRKITQHFLRGGANVHVDVRRIVELLRHPSTGRGGDQLLCTLDRARHANCARREFEFSAVREN